MMNQAEMFKYDMIVEEGIATANEINLVRCLVNGSWNEIFDKICYVRTGYRTYEQYIEATMEEEEEGNRQEYKSILEYLEISKNRI